MTGVAVTLVAFTTHCAFERGPQALEHSNEGGGGSNINNSTGLSGGLSKRPHQERATLSRDHFHDGWKRERNDYRLPPALLLSFSLLPPTKNGNVTPTIMAAARSCFRGSASLPLRFLTRSIKYSWISSPPCLHQLICILSEKTAFRAKWTCSPPRA